VEEDVRVRRANIMRLVAVACGIRSRFRMGAKGYS
jgi:hypothetical protein